ncbi:MAG: hypothetical protein GY765_06255 [bacterium]|nr:hypothetical protein [bacterium]
MGKPIEKHFALLLGVHQYSDNAFRPLPQTTNDVVELAKLLIRNGYEVATLYNQQDEEQRHFPTKENILARLRDVCGKCGPQDLLLISFCGHGELDNELNAYLVPGDGYKSNPRDSFINLEEFKKEIVDSPAQVKILFLDACHSGIGRDSVGMDPEFERHIFLEAEGTATLAACMRHEVAYNHNTINNGVFTYYLLKGLDGKADQQGKGFVTFDDIKKYVTHHIRTWAEARNHRQTPNSHSRLVGDPPLLDLKHKPAFKLKPTAAGYPANPFTDTLAILDPKRFVGRKNEMRRLLTLLQGGSVTIKGEPKIGKSSLMWQLAREWPGKKIGPINFDLLRNIDDLYQYIAKELKLPDCGWRTLRRVLENIELLLLWDELDVAPKRGIRHDDLSPFRALCENNRNFKIVAISRKKLNDIFPDTGMGSPFFNLLQPLTLEGLNQDDALELLEHAWATGALTFDNATCNKLLMKSELHPFKLQRAAFHYFEYLNDPGYNWKVAFETDIEQML